MPTAPDLLVAALADRYRIERELGAGGMATVYLAEDLKHHRRVAVKVFRPEQAATMGTERFAREIEVAARLQHPNILALHDSGEAAGFLFYVMPYVDGVSLRERLAQEGELPIADAVRILAEIAEALAYAHRQGVVHRDLKPDNIMLSGRHPMVMDFGIAKAVSASSGPRGPTTAGVALGTPAYMAPEQAVADPQIDHRVDIYAIGVMGYELLTGEPPFVARSAQQLLAAHVSQTPLPISSRRSTVPRALEAILMRCLEKLPADRPQSAEDVLRVLEALATPSGGTAPSIQMAPTTPWPAPRATGMFTRKFHVLAGAVAATAIIIILWWGGRERFATWSAQDRKPAAELAPQRLAVLYMAPMGDDPQLAAIGDGLTEGLLDSLRRAPQLDVISVSGVAAFRGTSVKADSVARVLGVPVVITGTIARTVVAVQGVPQDVLQVVVWMVDASSRIESVRDTLVASAAEIGRLQHALPKIALALIRERQAQRGDANAAWLTLQEGRRLVRQANAAMELGDSVQANLQFSAADSTLALAASYDVRWSEPSVQRAQLAYRRSRIVGRDAAAVQPWLARGMTHADRALQLDPRNADALEIRGAMRTYAAVSGAVKGASSDSVLRAAQADLEQATAINPKQAGAWSTLSFVYYQIPGKGAADVMAAAAKSLEADEFQPNAPIVRNRLFNSAYDLGRFTEADRFCADLESRYPGTFRAVRCRLYVQSLPGLATYDIDRSWRLVDSLVAASGIADKALHRLTGNIFTAATIARASIAFKSGPLADSARRVAQRSEGNATIDKQRDLMLFGAMVSTILGDKDAWNRRLNTYISVDPGVTGPALAKDPGWWFRSIAETPEWKRLVGPAPE